MKQKNTISLPSTGGSSLLVIFAVLCLVVFSLLALNTVLAEKRISDAFAENTANWYAADLEAQEIFARIRTGGQVPGVERTGDEYRYAVPISHHQTLLVALKEKDGCWEVLSWQTKAHPEDGDGTLPVWQGLEEE